MLPESSLRQLKKLRKDVKGIDINDRVDKDETTLPNLYWMENPVDGERIQSYDEFTKKDNKKQTVAFKSKLVNKPLVNKKLKENNNIAICPNCDNKFDYLSVKESGMKYVKCPKCDNVVTQKNYKNMKLEKFENFENSEEESGTYLIYSDDNEFVELYRGDFNSIEDAWEKADEIYVEKNQEIEHYDVVGPFNSDEEINKWKLTFDDEGIQDKAFEKKLNDAFSGVDADEESKNLFGFAQVKDRTIKKIGSFTTFTKMIDPKPPRERPVLNAGQFIDNDIVQGYVNRIEGSKVFIESVENPGEIVEISLKDAVKIKKVEKNHTATKKIDK